MENYLSFIESNHSQYLSELKEFLVIPSVSSQIERKPDMHRATEWLKKHMTNIGLQNVQIIETEGHPVIYADWLYAPGKPTILIYGHYDVQPEDPLDEWETPPFEATERDGKLYGRGTADDKGQLFIHLKALEAFLHDGGVLPVNVKIVVEGEEEIGSEHFAEFLVKHKELLKADVVLISDSDIFDDGVPAVTYALRGISYLEIEVTGTNSDLHSGTFGGVFHNPIQALTEIIALLHDKNGRITVKGMYDDVIPLTKEERTAFKKLPWNDRQFAKMNGVKYLYGEKGYTTLERRWARPTLECNGIWGGYTGEGAKTVIPSKAYAKISMRLVPNQSPVKIAKLFEKHIKRITPKTVKVEVRNLHGGEPAITPIDSPGVMTAMEAMEKGFGKKPLYQRDGASIPIVVDFKKILGIDSVLLGFGVPDENAHAPNEFIVLDNFFKGVVTVVHYYRLFPEFWKMKKKK